ncbi:hypothetical protein [Bacillus pumilus]|uniref:hypothetical protein n=1 Tax=Bacillus pumilus TaxID=1408 RepID=UPI0033064F92
MKKIKIELEEVLKYNSTMVVEVPDEISDEHLDDIWKRAEGEYGISNVSNTLSRFGIKVIQDSGLDPNSPSSTQLEITDVTEMEGEQDVK